jgi:hypothetical protein
MISRRTSMLLPAAVLIVIATAPLAAVDRPYDDTVDRLVDSACRRLDHFSNEMDSKAKGAKVTREGVEIDVSDFMKDWKGDCNLFQDRFGANDMASGNALDFVRKAKATEGFIARHPGFTGADSEWDDVRPAAIGLATAYNIDWDSDPATWKPVRSSDKAIGAMLAGVERQVKELGKSVNKAGKAAKVDKAALKGVSDSIAALGSSAKSFRSAFGKELPIGAAADGFFDRVTRVESGVAELGLGEATAAAMKPLAASAKNLGLAFGR